MRNRSIPLFALICALIIPLAGLWLASTAQAEGPGAIRLYEFDCGRIVLPSLQGFGISDDETDVREVAVPCYVIEHSKGRLLFDGGVSSDFASSADWTDYYGMQVRLDEPLADQLKAIGLDMSSFDFIAFSHLHWDHAGVANEIQSGQVIIQKPEFEAAFPTEGTPYAGFDPALIGHLKDLERVVIDGDYDVFGDGSVRIISSPGHTPGHQSLWVDLPNTGPVLLTGDLYHFPLNRTEQRVPDFNHDKEATRRSMVKVEELAKATGSQVWIGHELARFEQGKHAPDFYD